MGLILILILLGYLVAHLTRDRRMTEEELRRTEDDRVWKTMIYIAQFFVISLILYSCVKGW